MNHPNVPQITKPSYLTISLYHPVTITRPLASQGNAEVMRICIHSVSKTLLLLLLLLKDGGPGSAKGLETIVSHHRHVGSLAPSLSSVFWIVLS